MSRSGYNDDCDDWAIIRWRGAVASAISGARGQAMLRELLEALDAMPEKRLIAHDIVCSDGVCALGALGRKRGLDLSPLDPEDTATLASRLGVAEALVREVVFMNDEAMFTPETPDARWRRMRGWVAAQIKEPA